MGKTLDFFRCNVEAYCEKNAIHRNKLAFAAIDTQAYQGWFAKVDKADKESEKGKRTNGISMELVNRVDDFMDEFPIFPAPRR